MRVLWVSDSPTTPSGFGAVTRAVCGRLAQRGHRVEILGWQTHGCMVRWQGIPVHPVRHDTFGSDVVLGYLLRSQPQFIVTLADVWWMTFLADPAVQRYLDQSGTRWVMYFPLDGASPSGGLPSSWAKMLEAADLPVAMARFGLEVATSCGVACEYVPHGVDLELFAPPADKDAARARLGYDGAFVVLSDARNQPRKLIPRTLDIAALFAAGKDDVVVHLHCDPYDDAASSDLYRYRLLEDIAAMGLGGTVRVTGDFQMRASGGLPESELAALYAAADVHLLSSWGEGFGLPNLQASASGVVPVAVAYAASRELVDGHGFAVPIESTVVDEFGLLRCLIDRHGAAKALDHLYRDRADLAERSARSRSFAEGYGWDAVVDRWEEVLENAPKRRPPSRSQWYSWVAGEEAVPARAPHPVATVVSDALASLADGTRLEVQVTERHYGEMQAEILKEAFVEGDELSIPVRLPAHFEGAPTPVVGNVMASPASLPLAARLRRIFPGLVLSVPRPGGDPESDELVPLEVLAPALALCALVLDHDGDGAPGLDVACAALGIPYLGPSPLWPPMEEATPLRQARRLLTDQGFSSARREQASVAVAAAYGEEVVAAMRALVRPAVG